MRSAILLAVPLALAACGNSSKESQAAADAQAAKAGFVPPSVMSRLDYGSSVERRFRALDHNGDNAIELDELPPRASRLASLDRNGDGKITGEEWSDGMLARFDKMDLNHDGSVTSDERQQFERSQQQR